MKDGKNNIDGNHSKKKRAERANTKGGDSSLGESQYVAPWEKEKDNNQGNIKSGKEDLKSNKPNNNTSEQTYEPFGVLNCLFGPEWGLYRENIDSNPMENPALESPA